MTAIKTHHIAVQFDGRQEPYHVERVKGRFLVLKKHICPAEAVSTHPGICCHSSQMPGSVTGLCHNGPVQPGVLCRYGRLVLLKDALLQKKRATPMVWKVVDASSLSAV